MICHPLFLIGVLFVLPYSSIAQTQLLNSSRARMSALINMADGQMDIQNAGQIQGSIIRSASVRLEYDDLIIPFRLQSGREGDEYQITIQARLDGEIVQIHPEDLSGRFQEKIIASEAGDHEIIWRGLLDRYYDFTGQLEITLLVELWGKPILPFGVDCDQIPTFSSKQKMPYYAAAVVGFVSVGLSIVIGKEAQQVYDDNYLTQNFDQSAEPYYLDANDKRHTALLLRYAGITVLVADTALFLYRKSRHKKKLDTFNEFCGNRQVLVSPIFESTSSAVAGSQLGIKLVYHF